MVPADESEIKADSVLIWASLYKLYTKQEKNSDAEKALAKAKALPVREPTDKEGKLEIQALK